MSGRLLLLAMLPVLLGPPAATAQKRSQGGCRAPGAHGGRGARGAQHHRAVVPVRALSALTAPQQCARTCWRPTSFSWWMAHPALAGTTSAPSAPSWTNWWGPLCRWWARKRCASLWRSTAMIHGEPRGGGVRDSGAAGLGDDASPAPPRVEFPFSRHTDGTSVRRAIQQLSYKGGNTRTGAGFRYVADNFFGPTQLRPGVPQVPAGRWPWGQLGGDAVGPLALGWVSRLSPGPADLHPHHGWQVPG